jgi:hypothetical protein
VRFRSAGLGPTELKGKISDMGPIDKNLMVMHIKTYSPVEWHLKAGLEAKDVPKVVNGILKPAIFFHIVRIMFYLKKNPKEITDIMDKSISV